MADKQETINDAQARWKDASTVFANAAALFLLKHGADLNTLVKNKDLAQDLAELRNLNIDRNRKQDAYLLSLGGR
jgi:hypothetical protein